MHWNGDPLPLPIHLIHASDTLCPLQATVDPPETIAMLAIIRKKDEDWAVTRKKAQRENKNKVTL